jgi:hypothetical protein
MVQSRALCRKRVCSDACVRNPPAHMRRRPYHPRRILFGEGALTISAKRSETNLHNR